MKTSLLLSIYNKNTVEQLDRCFGSIVNGSYVPEEVVLIVDGCVDSSITRAINKWRQILPINTHQFKNNMGLAHALNHGLRLCSNDWVFRMDIDDVCADDRFARQAEIINTRKDIDILGGNILCFDTYPNLTAGRNIPIGKEEIRQFVKLRNPINHPTVVFNRRKILEIGGYPSARLGQDYLLWITALAAGLTIQNTEEVLVYMQVDRHSYSRRGLRNFKYDAYPYILMYKKNMVSFPELLFGLIFRFTYCTYCTVRATLSL